MVGRSGRAQKIAFDETPLNAPRPDLGARLGWLLAMSRLHHRAEEFQDGTRFAESLGRAGFPASRSLVSRWESGRIPISFEGMAAYERVLSLEPGRITSVVGYLRSLPEDPLPGRPPAARPGRPGLRGPVRRADRRGGAGHGARPAVAGARLAPVGGADGAPARADLGHPVAAGGDPAAALGQRRLLPAEHGRDEHGDPAAAQDFLVDAIATYMSDPAVQVVANPLVLLDHLPTREAARLVLEVVEKPPRTR